MSDAAMMWAGRGLMGAGFLVFGLWNIRNHAAIAELIRGRRVPVPGFAAALGIGTQIAGGVLLMAGLWPWYTAFTLIAFVTGATLLAHVPLGREPQRRRENIIASLTNVIIVGGLFAIAAVGR
jgi:putative oxidoreductase